MASTLPPPELPAQDADPLPENRYQYLGWLFDDGLIEALLSELDALEAGGE